MAHHAGGVRHGRCLCNTRMRSLEREEAGGEGAGANPGRTRSPESDMASAWCGGAAHARAPQSVKPGLSLSQSGFSPHQGAAESTNPQAGREAPPHVRSFEQKGGSPACLVHNHPDDVVVCKRSASHLQEAPLPRGEAVQAPATHAASWLNGTRKKAAPTLSLDLYQAALRDSGLVKKRQPRQEAPLPRGKAVQAPRHARRRSGDPQETKYYGVPRSKPHSAHLTS